MRRTVPDQARIDQLVAAHGPDAVIKSGGKWFDAATGAALEKRLSLWSGPFVGRGAGFVSVNDGVAFAEQLLAALEGKPIRPSDSPGVHPARAVDAHVDELLAKRRESIERYNATVRKLRDAA